MGATAAALLVATIVLIADKFPFVNRFPDKPLMYNVVWKYCAPCELIRAIGRHRVQMMFFGASGASRS